MSRILIIIAVLPALILLGFIYMRDRKEKPPVKLMVLLLALGAGTIIPAAIAEFIGQLIVAQTDTDHQTMLLMLCFLVIGIVEELGKYLVTVCTTWKSREFQHSYDGVIYMVCASLGFAILENILYVASGGIGTGILRAFTAIPLHCTVGVIMGALYAKGREAAYAGDRAGMIGFMAWAYIVPVFIHGLYDYLVMAASYGYISEAWVFLTLGVMYVLSIFLIFYCSAHDRRIDGRPETADYGMYRMDFRRPGRGYYYPDQPDYRAGYPGYPGGDAYGQAGGYMQNTNYTPYNGGYTQGMNQYPGNGYAQGMNQYPGNGYVQGMNQYPGNGYAQGMNQYPQTGVNPYRQQENPGSQNYSQSYTSNGTGTDYGMTGYNGQGQK
ncbi:PrsW family intramembrane metalloprotease [Coprococcus sp. NSJ-10]|uniref:PrsW family intramembrane metalloprotease n=1 Tax=Coprococcus hominis (ex Liu et al. 2022) TaxID=2763039 RepID=A0A8I0DRL8_9FIRM|nr:PrsW family glutamic-type intramembrane protease [Coprococcus hominis (ex Liu et al. 2022)]MBC5662198.1 PrsW family intramembrane metalloprotease [Coprococcus hominis (ex Liu et al. 2022)]